MARKPSEPESAKGRPRTNWTALWMFVLGLGMVVISLPTVMLLLFGMLPTIVAYIVDRSHQKAATYCVAGMNFCGLFPYLLELWFGTHSMKAAGDILTDVFALLVIYAAAAFGWMLFVAIPPVVGTFLTVIAQRRVAQLRTLQRQIIEEWGASVTNPEATGAAAAPPPRAAVQAPAAPPAEGAAEDAPPA